MLDKDGYPTQETLETVKKWDFEKNSIEEFLEYLEENWWYPERHVVIKNRKNYILLQLHTGGWSGNEDMISACMDNRIFWSRCWERTYRGGHYYFKINKALFKRRTKD